MKNVIMDEYNVFKGTAEIYSRQFIYCQFYDEKNTVLLNVAVVQKGNAPAYVNLNGGHVDFSGGHLETNDLISNEMIIEFKSLVQKTYQANDIQFNLNKIVFRGVESLETEELFWMNILNQSMIKIDEHVKVLIIK